MRESNRSHIWSTCTYYTREFSERRYRTILPILNSQKCNPFPPSNSMLNSDIYENANFLSMPTRCHFKIISNWMALYRNLFVIQFNPIGNIRYIIYLQVILSILRALVSNDKVLDEFRMNISLKRKCY